MHPKLRCPICKRALGGDPGDPDSLPPTAPFCGQRCKTADLGNWLDNRYAIDAGPAPTNGDDGMTGLETFEHE